MKNTNATTSNQSGSDASLASNKSGLNSTPDGRHFLAGDIITDKSEWCETSEHWRVNAYLKRVEDTLFNDTESTGDTLKDLTRKVVRESVLKQKQRRIDNGLPANRRYRYQWCLPEEATHLACSGVCGNIVAIEDATFVRVVDWTQDKIEDERKSASSHFIGEFTEYEWE